MGESSRNYIDEALSDAGVEQSCDSDVDQSRSTHPKQAVILIDLAAAGCTPFHDANRIAYADVGRDGHRETWPVRRKGFRSWLAKQFYDATGGAASSEAMQQALAVIEAQALYDGDEHEVCVRVGAHNNRIYIDLCDDKRRAIEIGADGWTIIGEPPIRFCRTDSMRPLPEPQRGGSIDHLRPLINVKDDRDFVLIIAWLLAALRPRGPYPILVPIGEPGTAKSTLARILRALVDPNKAPLRSLSQEERDLFISASNMWVLSFDNVSVMPQWLSDGLCRLATGGGLATRSLYTDSDEMVFDATRPIVLNGIENFVVRGDLADRALVIPLAQISEKDRLTEEALWVEIERQLPLILGALCDAVAVGIKRLPTVKLSSAPRLADFARWAAAACPEIKAADGQVIDFLKAYAGNRLDAVENVLEADAVAVAIRSFMADRTEWRGTATELLGHLNSLVGEKAAANKAWPKDATRLGGSLNRVASHLRMVGIDVQRDQRRATGRKITITRPVTDQVGGTASPASPASSANDTNGFEDDADGDADRQAAAPASQLPSLPIPMQDLDNDRSDAGDTGARTQSGDCSSPADATSAHEISVTRSHCDHCGEPDNAGNRLRPWDWEGRQIWLHGACEAGWRDAERIRKPPVMPRVIDGDVSAELGADYPDMPASLRRTRSSPIGPPAISAGPDDDLGDIDPGWQR
jgi:hypothetical protein